MIGLCSPAWATTWVERPLSEQSSSTALVPLPPSPQLDPVQSEERSPLSHSPEVSGRSSGSPGRRHGGCGQHCWDAGGSPGPWVHVNHPIFCASASLSSALCHRAPGAPPAHISPCPCRLLSGSQPAPCHLVNLLFQEGWALSELVLESMGQYITPKQLLSHPPKALHCGMERGAAHDLALKEFFCSQGSW